MTAKFRSLGLDQLGLEDRLALVDELWNSIAADTPASTHLPIFEAQRLELHRRAHDDDANPDDVVPWEQVKADALARWAR